jgi:hypothetical protein
MSKKSKKRNEESSSSSSSNSLRGKGVRGVRSESSNESPKGKGVRAAQSESPNRKGVRGLTESPNGSDLGGLFEKKLRKKISTNNTATPVAGAASNGTGTGGAIEALRAVLDSGMKQKKSKKASKKCRQSDDSCWE